MSDKSVSAIKANKRLQRVSAALLLRLATGLALVILASGCIFSTKHKIENFTHTPLDGRAEEILAEMKIDQKVAQMLMVELEGSIGPSTQDKRLINVHSMGGVIAPSLNSASLAVEYNTSVYEAAETNKFRIAPFVATDTPHIALVPATQFPAPMALSATGDPDTVRDVAVRTAAEMRAMGLTMTFGPTGDVCTELAGPAVSLNCFGSEPNHVADMVAATVSGYQSQGVIAAVTNFPGLGDVDTMPHEGLPILVKRVPDLARQDLLPYNRAVREGAAALLVTHVVAPLLDDSLAPASMSQTFLKELLRDTWRFGGLAICDSLNQKAISTRYKPDEASINTIKAGADMIVWRGSYTRYIRTLKMVSDAIVNGEIPKEQIDRSVLRILRLKEAYGLLDPSTIKESLDKGAVGKKNAAIVAERAAKAAVTVFKNEDDLLPLDTETTNRIALISLVHPDAIMKKLKTFDISVRMSHAHTAQVTKWNPESFEIDRALKLAGQAQVAIVTIVPYDGVVPTEQRRLLYKLGQTDVQIIALVMGVPIDLENEKAVKAAIATYTPPVGKNVNMSVIGPAIDCIFGKASITLNLPHEIQTRRGHPLKLDLGLMSLSPPGKLPVSRSDRTPSRYMPIMKDKHVKWKFGDGKSEKGPVATHTYEKIGMYEMSVECKDPFGERVSAITTVVVGE